VLRRPESHRKSMNSKITTSTPAPPSIKTRISTVVDDGRADASCDAEGAGGAGSCVCVKVGMGVWVGVWVGVAVLVGVPVGEEVGDAATAGAVGPLARAVALAANCVWR
jgi:hypothetical protein